MPSIQAKRALVSWKDGRQILVVESALTGGGKEFGWIIPLPSIPDRIEKSSSGLFDTLYMSLHPKIIHDKKKSFTAVACLGGMVFFIAFTIIVLRIRAGWKRALLFAVVFLILLAVALPGLMSSSNTGQQQVKHIKVYRRNKVGNYAISVLTAGSGVDLSQWLSDNKLAAIPGEGIPIVDSYIKKGWCFAAVKFSRDSKGPAVPHPLAFRFKSKKPVYPLQLTRLGAAEIPLELYVAAPGRVGHKNLSTRYSAEFVFSENAPVVHHSEKAIGYHSRGEAALGHPEALKFLPGNCWITRLRGKLNRDQMKDDLYLEFRKNKFIRRTLYDSASAWQMAGILGFFVLSISTSILLIIKRSSLGRKEGRAYGIKHILLPSFTAALLLFLAFWRILPVAEIKFMGNFPEFRALEMLYKIKKDLNSPLIRHSSLNNKELSKKCVDFFKVNKLFNPFSGSLIEEGDSPGDIRVFRSGGRPYLVMYDSYGFPWYALPAESDTKKTEL
jgi:hypothetical protein